MNLSLCRDRRYPACHQEHGQMIGEPVYNELAEGADYIIDAASNASPNFFKQNPVEVMKANINGVSNLLEYGLSHRMQRMVYISSGEIYGEGDGSEFTEKSSGYVDLVHRCVPAIHLPNVLPKRSAWHTEQEYE